LVVAVVLLALGSAQPADAAPASAVGTFERVESWGQSNTFTGRFSDGTRTYQGVAATNHYYPGLPHAGDNSRYHFTLTSQTPGGLAGTCDTIVAVDTRDVGYALDGLPLSPVVSVLDTVGPLLPPPLDYATLRNLVLQPFLLAYTPTDKFTCQLSVNGGPVTPITWFTRITSVSSSGPNQTRASGVFAG
jgi:hypothetical protein